MTLCREPPQHEEGLQRGRRNSNVEWCRYIASLEILCYLGSFLFDADERFHACDVPN